MRKIHLTLSEWHVDSVNRADNNMTMSKHSEIRKHMQMNGAISGIRSMTRYDLYRLSSVINRLRREGMDIATEMCDNGVNTFAMYHLVDEALIKRLIAENKTIKLIRGVKFIVKAQPVVDNFSQSRVGK